MDTKTLIINLKILGQIDTGMKINTQQQYFTLDDKRFQNFTRWYRTDNRHYTYEKISNLVENLSRLYSEEKQPPVGYTNENFKEILENAVTGLCKLKTTYMDDKTFVSMLEVEIDLLNRIVAKIPVSPVKKDKSV